MFKFSSKSPLSVPVFWANSNQQHKPAKAPGSGRNKQLEAALSSELAVPRALQRLRSNQLSLCPPLPGDQSLVATSFPTSWSVLTSKASKHVVSAVWGRSLKTVWHKFKNLWVKPGSTTTHCWLQKAVSHAPDSNINTKLGQDWTAVCDTLSLALYP